MKRIITVMFTVGLLAALWVFIAPPLAVWLVVERPMTNADAIIVLSGSAAYKERTKKAAELYKQGVSAHIFITDDGERSGWNKEEQTNLPFVELEKRELIAGGVPADAITVLPTEVSGTDQEAKVLATEIDTRPLNSVLIVTSAYHTRRALRTFNKILAGKGVEIGIEHAPISDRSPKPDYWWLSPRGWSSVGAEYVKLAVYWVMY